MHRLPRLLSPLLTACGLAFVVLAALGRLPDPGWRWAVVGVSVIGGAAIWPSASPRPFAPVVVVAGLHLAGLDLPATAGAPRHVGDAAVSVLVGVLLCLLMLVAVRRRYGRLEISDVIDLLVVVIGVGLVAWVVVANPLVTEVGAGRATALLEAAYLPLAALLVVFSADVACSGLQRNRAMLLVMLATVGNLIGSWVIALRSVDRLGDGAGQVAVAALAVALCAVIAALVHPSIADTLSPAVVDGIGAEGVPRLFVVGTSVLLPIGFVAVIAPTSTFDATVRTIAVCALVVAVIVRLTIATHQNRSARETLLRQLNEDDLTKLPTRSRFADELHEILERTWHSPQRPTVVRLNLDRFKNVNDSFGHYTANEVLVELAGRLRTYAAGFGGTVGRLGGDDFAVVDATTTSCEAGHERAEEIRQLLSGAITVGDHSVFLTASIGVAVAPRNRTVSADDLMRHADIATHQAKQDGRNRIAVFDESMQARATRRMDVEHALHGAIGRQEMRLYHQPIIDITTGTVAGFEALMRWQRQDGTLVPPLDFIPVAEETGLICELGAWALRDALIELRRWIDDGVVGPTTTMSVNASPRQVADPGFPDVVRAALAESGIPPHLLWIEITESMMLDEPDLVRETLGQVRGMGVRIALDDFGTGFSSLSVLQQFPIQRIKIDRTFVQRLGEGSNERSLVRTIIAMAQSMALDLVAEGVETVSQLESLRGMGCDKAQGFLISRPVPADAMRSTMVAIDEFAEISIFAAPRPAGVPTVEPAPLAHDEPATGPIGPIRLAGVGPMMPLTPRPPG